MFIIDYLHRRALKKNASKVSTGITPLESIRTAVAFIDVEDPSFDDCKNALMAFFRERGIKGEIFFFDFRKLNDSERLITSITNTVLKKDLNFFGKPSREKISLMLNHRPDLFISLISKDDFPIEFMAKCSEAKFKIGRKQLPGDTFDIVFTGTENADGTVTPMIDIFKSMKVFLAKIR